MKEAPPIPARNVRGKKTRNPGYEPGNHWVICDICGCAIRAKDARFRWDNAVVCPDDWEPRHPQDFVYAKADKIIPDEPIRPEGDVIFTGTVDVLNDFGTYITSGTPPSLTITENNPALIFPVAAVGDLYIAANTNNAGVLYTYDASDPTSLSLIEGPISLTGLNISHVVFDLDNEIMYYNHAGSNAAAWTLRAVDISDITSPIEIDTIVFDNSIAYFRLSTDKSKLYLLRPLTEELVVVDVSDPNNMSIISTKDTTGVANSPEIFTIDETNGYIIHGGIHTAFQPTLKSVYFYDINSPHNLLGSYKFGTDGDRVNTFQVDEPNSLLYYTDTLDSLTVRCLDYGTIGSIVLRDTLTVSTGTPLRIIKSLIDSDNEVFYAFDFEDDIWVIDISDPDNLALISTVTTIDQKTSLIKLFDALIIDHNEYTNNGKIIFVSDIESPYQFKVIDATDPSNLTEIDSVLLSNSSFTSQMWFGINGV